MNTKLSYQGKTIQYVNTWKVKSESILSSFKSICEKKLSQRFHITPEGLKIQRDCFSAWLIKIVNKAKTEVNRQKCLENFDSFYQDIKRPKNIFGLRIKNTFRVSVFKKQTLINLAVLKPTEDRISHMRRWILFGMSVKPDADIKRQ